MLGRSLSMASSDQARQVNAASAALSAGSGLLAAQVGAKLGLDDAGVNQSRALGGAVLGVGKFITPQALRRLRRVADPAAVRCSR